jgi:hypothetical protein
VARTVIRKLVAFDAAGAAGIPVEPGAILQACRVLRNPSFSGMTDVYVVEFEVAGRTLRYPLVDFQARTQAMDSGVVRETPARETATIS